MPFSAIRAWRQRLWFMPLLSVLIFASLDTYCRNNCYTFLAGSGATADAGTAVMKLDATPPGFMAIWLATLVITLASSLISLPRWSAWLALLIVCILAYFSVDSRWSMGFQCLVDWGCGQA